MQARSPSAASGATGSACLPEGTDSPVNAASSIARFLLRNRRKSAGTRVPDSSSTTSPGTSSAASTSSRSPWRTTVAWLASMARTASRARWAFPSWTSPMMALITTTPTITAVSTTWPSHRVMKAAASNT